MPLRWCLGPPRSKIVWGGHHSHASGVALRSGPLALARPGPGRRCGIERRCPGEGRRGCSTQPGRGPGAYLTWRLGVIGAQEKRGWGCRCCGSECAPGGAKGPARPCICNQREGALLKQSYKTCMSMDLLVIYIYRTICQRVIIWLLTGISHIIQHFRHASVF